MPDAVRLWEEPVVIPTYPVPPADLNPMFLERRVYQGSSGKVYPCPFTDRVSDEPVARSYRAVHLENEFLSLMLLPELGGRVHAARDKTNDYDFIYRQSVIKPALVGLLGPWISGGIEFNWPQHHRPTTFMPVDYCCQEDPDGSKTVWMGEHEPMNRTKGMVGICLRPGRAVLEAKVRLYNRTPLAQTFLWWANVGVHVHDQYQAFFPPDVRHVADHAKRAMSRFPICRDYYYGVDYRRGVDLRWYRNIPVPTSYMAMGSQADFFGGYDHRAQAGLVHIANHHIAPGKKLWTWGNHEFGYAWDRELTENDGPYVELMAGVYTDNQPDFSWLAPFETRAFRQFWYPIQKIGPPKHATLDAAVNLEVRDRKAEVGVSVSRIFAAARVSLTAKGRPVLRETVTLAPGAPFVRTLRLPTGAAETGLCLQVVDREGRELLCYRPSPPPARVELPSAATEPRSPEETATTEELFLTGLHLEQYRHATRDPELYWREALRRDPWDARNNNALGLWHLRRGEFVPAERHFRQAVETLTRRNPNPCDGEASYHLGLALRYQGRFDEAYAAFYKAAWNYAWQSASYFALAELDCRRSDWDQALEHLDLSLANNLRHGKARNLKAVVLGRLGRNAEAESLRREILACDPLDAWARTDPTAPLPVQTALDVAFDLANAGLFPEAIQRLINLRADHPMVHYALGRFAGELGQSKQSLAHYRRARRASPDYCFPSRLEEMLVLEAALLQNPRDARAHYYLGNLLYDKKRHEAALGHWETAARLDGSFSIVWRNLGMGYYNIRRDPARAKTAYLRALAANPRDARLLYELDQLLKRLGTTPRARWERLEKHRELVRRRDDLSVEYAALCNQTGRSERALACLEARRFHPWEGGEGLALGQYVRTRVLLGCAALRQGRPQAALDHFSAALHPPPNLGEARHLLANPSEVHFWLGEAAHALGDKAAAKRWWLAATDAAGDFQEMKVRSFSEGTFYCALSLQRLGRRAQAARLSRQLLAHARRLESSKARIDYFATSLPALLLFREDLQRRQTVAARFLMAQANFGLGRAPQARRLVEKVLRLDPNHELAGMFRRIFVADPGGRAL